MAELAGTRDHVEFPQEIAGPGVIAENVAGNVLDARLVIALLAGIADDHDAIDDDRWGRRRDVTDFQGCAFVRIVFMPEVGEQVDDARFRKTLYGDLAAESRQRSPGLCIQRRQEEGRRNNVDDATPVDFGVRDALAVILAHRILEAPGIRFPV